MHPNPAFRQASKEQNIGFARDVGFGILAVSAPDGPLLSHIPFLLGESGETIELHLVRSNPIVGALTEPARAVIAVQGPHGYVSPDWYGIDDQVPTWNYVAVHLRGRLERQPDHALRPLLDRLSETFEGRLLPKPPWSTENMTPDILLRMMRMIVPFRMTVERVDGTWKLNQNKHEDVRLAAAEAVEGQRAGQETGKLAALMRRAPVS